MFASAIIIFITSLVRLVSYAFNKPDDKLTKFFASTIFAFTVPKLEEEISFSEKSFLISRIIWSNLSQNSGKDSGSIDTIFSKKIIARCYNSDLAIWNSSCVSGMIAESQPEVIPSYIVELAKSGRAECRRCDKKISNKELRVGVVIESSMGIFTRWQHLNCTVFHKSIKSVILLDGYFELGKEDQELLRDRVQLLYP